MLLQADTFDLPFPSGLFHAIVTSPPYWGLRKYMGDASADPLGLESSLDRYIERTVVWAKEVGRVLRPDGVFWLNLGDCFSGSGGENANTGLQSNEANTDDGTRSGLWRNNPRQDDLPPGNLCLVPHKVAAALQADGWIIRNDLVWFKRNPMPENTVGWSYSFLTLSEQIFRNDWRRERGQKEKPIQTGIHKNAPAWLASEIYEKCKSVCGEDGFLSLSRGSWRHTRNHESIFQFSKGMGYWSDKTAILEPYTETLNRWGGLRIGEESVKRSKYIHEAQAGPNSVLRKGRRVRPDPSGRNPRGVLNFSDELDLELLWSAFLEILSNPGDVLDVPTSGYSGFHYATFTPELIVPLILSSVPRWCCPVCGTGWSPVVAKNFSPQNDVSESSGVRGHTDQKDMAANNNWQGTSRGSTVSNVLAYYPSCDHPHDRSETQPGIVLDPFGGSGTTGMVARDLLRRWVVMDISRPYLDEQAKLRTGSGMPSSALDNLPLFSQEEE